MAAPGEPDADAADAGRPDAILPVEPAAVDNPPAAPRPPPARRLPSPGAVARAALRAVGALVVLFLALVALYAFVEPVSTLMLARLVAGRPVERVSVPLADVSPAMVAAVIAAEDATFCANSGVDWPALRAALAAPGGPARGASTLTMQTVKNLFLWPGRSFVRKGVEIPMALVLGGLWPKRRVIEVYLNVAEWGDGVFGVEAAARRAFGKSAAGLTAREGALLASALPNPRERDPARPGAKQRRRAAIILERARDPGATACL